MLDPDKSLPHTFCHFVLQALQVLAPPSRRRGSNRLEAAWNVDFLKWNPSPASEMCSVKNSIKSFSSSKSQIDLGFRALEVDFFGDIAQEDTTEERCSERDWQS